MIFKCFQHRFQKQPRLEKMGSQDQLKGLIETSMQGLNECRKRLEALGDNPDPADVQAVLQSVSRCCRYLIFCGDKIYAYMISVYMHETSYATCFLHQARGSTLYAELQEAHADRKRIASRLYGALEILLSIGVFLMKYPGRHEAIATVLAPRIAQEKRSSQPKRSAKSKAKAKAKAAEAAGQDGTV